VSATRRLPSLLLAATCLSGALAGAWPAQACAPAPRAGLFARVTGEAALVVWDADAKVEHFVRTARFEGGGEDFGFLVPTPTRPTLAEAEDPFGALERYTRPPIIRQVDSVSFDPRFLCLGPNYIGASGPPPGSVRVLETTLVSGYEASVLAASDTTALLAWLAEHRYDARPALRDWLDVYVRAGWIVTAFKVVDGATAPVRMSFPTDRPFFPYREPADQRDARAAQARTLRLYVVTPDRREARLGAAPAPLTLEWARPADDLKDVLGRALPPDSPLNAGQRGLWLHAWLDESSPRPGTDELYFDPAPGQGRFDPAPVVQPYSFPIPVPIDFLAVGGAALAFVVVRRRRARSALGEKGAP
jgi:hypothetical protein